jgi:hypothetical protein
MRYTHYRGLAQVYNWVRLKFAAMNLKKLARWKTRKRFAPSSSATSYILSLINFVACLVMKTDRPLFDRLVCIICIFQCLSGLRKPSFVILNIDDAFCNLI